MREVSDAFLLQVADISAGLVGLFLVGIFIYVETGFHRSRSRTIVEPYFRAATTIVLIVYAIPILLPLTLVALEPVWSRVLYAILSILIVGMNVDTVIRVRKVAKETSRSLVLVVNEIVSTLAVVPLVAVPWVLGGLEPSREDLTWAILLAFGLGFLSIVTLVISAFDIARMEAAEVAAEEDV